MTYWLGEVETHELCPFGYLEKWSNAERYKLVRVSLDVGADPGLMAAMIKIESGGDPRAANPKSSARGLIQWTDATAKSAHGVSSYSIPSLGICAQLDLVREYFEKVVPGGVKAPGDEYVAVAGSAYVGKPADAVMYESPDASYALNKGWDLDKDGAVTVGEVRALVISTRNAVCKSGPPVIVTPEACPVAAPSTGGFLRVAGIVAVGAGVWYAWTRL